jgi:uncharacterized membrane protein YgcG
VSGRKGDVASSILLVVVGLWLLLQTIVGDLPRRLLSWRGVSMNAARPSTPADRGESGLDGSGESGGGVAGGGGSSW